MWFSIPLQVLLLLLSVLTFVYWYIRNQFSFWARQGVPFSKPHWFFGNTGDWVMAKITMTDLLLNVYREFKNERFCGIWRFFAPTLVVIDPELISNILVRDCDTWSLRGLPITPNKDPLSKNLAFVNGGEWKSMRSNSSPAYTPGKLKQMFKLLVESSKSLEEYLNTQVNVNDGVIEVDEVCRMYITEANGLSTLGIRLNSFSEDNLIYRRLKKEVFEVPFLRKTALLMQIVSTRLFKFLKIGVQTPEITDFFLNIVEQNLDYRNKNNVQGHNFLDLFRGLQSTGKPPAGVEAEFLAGQLFDFFVSGFESTSRVISHALHELALNQDVQGRLREDVRTAKAADNGEITWDAMNNMKYLDMVVQETLRKYPAPLVFRMSVKTYRIPDADVELPPGTMCFIPVGAIHQDPKYYPDPDKFDPERFTNEAKSRRPACTFLPFGFGPRNCIALRFGEHQIKAALITIIDNFKISLCEKSQIPLEFDPEDLFLCPKDGIWLRFFKDSSNSKSESIE